jgi:hypothetical protein
VEVNERKEIRTLNPKGMMLALDRFTLRRRGDSGRGRFDREFRPQVNSAIDF